MKAKYISPLFLAGLHTATAEYTDPALHHTVIVTVTGTACAVDSDSSSYPVVNVAGQASYIPVTTVTWIPPAYTSEVDPSPKANDPSPISIDPTQKQPLPAVETVLQNTQASPATVEGSIAPAPAAPTPSSPSVNIAATTSAVYVPVTSSDTTPVTVPVAASVTSISIGVAPVETSSVVNAPDELSTATYDAAVFTPTDIDTTVTVWSTAPTPEIWVTVYENSSSTTTQWTTYTQTFTKFNSTYTQTLTALATAAAVVSGNNNASAYNMDSLANTWTASSAVATQSFVQNSKNTTSRAGVPTVAAEYFNNTVANVPSLNNSSTSVVSSAYSSANSTSNLVLSSTPTIVSPVSLTTSTVSSKSLKTSAATSSATSVTISSATSATTSSVSKLSASPLVSSVTSSVISSLSQVSASPSAMSVRPTSSSSSVVSSYADPSVLGLIGPKLLTTESAASKTTSSPSAILTTTTVTSTIIETTSIPLSSVYSTALVAPTVNSTLSH